jgi:1-piperideine-2-carboxylate/1-pyrroline-2-carboxylate reductase [NAD(P)H]
MQVRLYVSHFPTLAQIVRGEVAVNNKAPLLFKSCGWAGWDLAAAGLAVAAI